MINQVAKRMLIARGRRRQPHHSQQAVETGMETLTLILPQQVQQPETATKDHKKIPQPTHQQQQHQPQHQPLLRLFAYTTRLKQPMMQWDLNVPGHTHLVKVNFMLKLITPKRHIYAKCKIVVKNVMR